MNHWILLRGLMRESGHWGDFPRQLQQAFPDVHIECLDLPGNGRSFQTRSPTDIYRMLETMRSMRHSRTPAHLLALSLGGMVAVEWARRYPQELRSLVLMNTSMRPFSPPWQRLRPNNYLRLLQAAVAREPARREAILLRLSSNRQQHAVNAEILSHWITLATTQPVSMANALRQLLAAARFRAPLRAPDIPVTLLQGGKDRLVNPACSSAIARAWNVPLRCATGAGHDLTLDDPKWVIEQLHWHLSTLSPQ